MAALISTPLLPKPSTAASKGKHGSMHRSLALYIPDLDFANSQEQAIQLLW